ncbi:butyrophilin subfamily 1 member A1-like [Notolabrus celidotus]|uniref:butyrophilin subfamily 1 member A1-like n=1 Tax=Notolabrus celidotus TaxID=1203425 RepID=UPI0014900182|nr:butyrophilin subfamily 1 member A1-like [Notolabrus celidotus]
MKEGSDVVLPCSLSSKENIESKLFDWMKDGDKEVFIYDGGLIHGNGYTGQDDQFEGRVSHFQDELKNSNASIKISKTKVSDSGVYTCIFPHLQPSQTFHIQLVVECVLKDRAAENIPGVSMRPSVMAQYRKGHFLLQCEVHGASPKPKVEWRDSSGNILQSKEAPVRERGGSYDIILQTTETKTDHYSCVVTQEEICHQVDGSVFVHFQGSCTGWMVSTWILLLLLLLLLIAGYFFRRKVKRRRSPNVNAHQNAESEGIQVEQLLSNGENQS